MDLSNGFRIANLVVALFMVLGGIAEFFPINFSHVVLGVYVILFGLATAGLEFQTPSYVVRYASFFFSFLGRGIFYIFIGSIILTENWYNYVAGAVVGIVGVVYVVLEFIPQIEPPGNMKDAEQGWGAEQV